MAAALLLAGCGSSTSPIPSQFSNLSTPKTVMDRAIEARSTADIAKDTVVFLAANGAMLDSNVFSLTTEVYEQRLLVTGLVTEVNKCGPLREAFARIEGLKQLYWHVLCIPRAEQREQGAIGEFRRAILRTKANLRLFGAGDVADVNLRVAVDAQRNAVLLGRARSEEERAAAIDATSGDGINSVIDYIEVRP